MPLQNSQYDSIMRKYDETRERHRQALDRRTQEVYEKLPEVKSLDDAVASESVAFARRRIADPALPMDGLLKRLDGIAAKRMEILRKYGYPPDYLEMHYDCPICRDTGFAEGKPCVCFRKAVISLLYDNYGLDGILLKENFSRFSFDWYSDKIKNEATGKTAREMAQEAYMRAKAFTPAIGSEDNNLLIYGNTGVGKTFLTHCIAKEALDRSFSVLYFSTLDLFDILSKAVFDRSEAGSSYEQMILVCDLLIIDDLGTELTNSFVASRLFFVINERIAHKRSTIISTNLTLEEFSVAYTERIFSRLMSHYTALKLIGEDIRIQKKLKGGNK
ncbi:MAG TPA: ATP-binding protein [Lachnospiraceae bacterium]|jgi:DNA replication protein DnaC|nr:ATP-binding protein [Lachnospiraceae bacterium]